MLTRLAKIDSEKPVLIAGPTASGKSRLALEIAQAQGGVIVNADALQVYDCWRILTARPTAAEEAAAPHLLYGQVGRDMDYSVGHWLREVQGVIESGLRPIIVGGTGLYFSALTEGLAVIPDTPKAVRAEADAIMRNDGSDALLAGLDAATRVRIDTANPARIQRAWEVLQSTGRGLAEWQAATPAPALPLGSVTAVVMRPDRDWLGDRIDARFDAMIETGALDEARAELPYWNPARPSARAIGAPELIAHLQGALSLADAVAAAKVASRQYAKRQRTWFRNRMKDWRPLTLP